MSTNQKSSMDTSQEEMFSKMLTKILTKQQITNTEEPSKFKIGPATFTINSDPNLYHVISWVKKVLETTSVSLRTREKKLVDSYSATVPDEIEKIEGQLKKIYSRQNAFIDQELISYGDPVLAYGVLEMFINKTIRPYHFTLLKGNLRNSMQSILMRVLSSYDVTTNVLREIKTIIKTSSLLSLLNKKQLIYKDIICNLDDNYYAIYNKPRRDPQGFDRDTQVAYLLCRLTTNDKRENVFDFPLESYLEYAIDFVYTISKKTDTILQRVLKTFGPKNNTVYNNKIKIMSIEERPIFIKGVIYPRNSVLFENDTVSGYLSNDYYGASRCNDFSLNNDIPFAEQVIKDDEWTFSREQIVFLQGDYKQEPSFDKFLYYQLLRVTKNAKKDNVFLLMNDNMDSIKFREKTNYGYSDCYNQLREMAEGIKQNSTAVLTVHNMFFEITSTGPLTPYTDIFKTEPSNEHLSLTELANKHINTSGILSEVISIELLLEKNTYVLELLNDYRSIKARDMKPLKTIVLEFRQLPEMKTPVFRDLILKNNKVYDPSKSLLPDPIVNPEIAYNSKDSYFVFKDNNNTSYILIDNAVYFDKTYNIDTEAGESLKAWLTPKEDFEIVDSMPHDLYPFILKAQNNYKAMLNRLYKLCQVYNYETSPNKVIIFEAEYVPEAFKGWLKKTFLDLKAPNNHRVKLTEIKLADHNLKQIKLKHGDLFIKNDTSGLISIVCYTTTKATRDNYDYVKELYGYIDLLRIDFKLVRVRTDDNSLVPHLVVSDQLRLYNGEEDIANEFKRIRTDAYMFLEYKFDNNLLIPSMLFRDMLDRNTYLSDDWFNNIQMVIELNNIKTTILGKKPVYLIEKMYTHETTSVLARIMPVDHFQAI